ncbi:homocysteine S-methyltransferase family protein [Paralimibaculum aggregatum]|uniref:Homocysteine S-methyltransferase family protein n=1 Tax=Paralimibaculum aggregatum TaxID=3036245 RepID=A0ABQ6LC79_9RHOB|nr:homocysteine S-methyltransferase family protein [Limibaculum sp. NKW23]GMG80987.1 homocysteine S-methyltransferase family protein [Limibaculum sp. NKW23]
MSFPAQRDGVIHLTEGGTETEIMYKFGHELPEFAAFPLLDKPDAAAALRGMYQRYLDVCARHGLAALMAGLDYRLSPDWGARLGYSPEGLAEMQARCIAFLREVAAPYAGQIPEIRIAGGLGPRGDAYGTGGGITEAEAEDYHAWQLGELARLGVDIVWAATFNNVPEAVGVARAAHRLGLPLTISFTLTGEHRLRSGASLKEAVEETDRLAGEAAPAFYGINCSHPLEFAPAIEPGDWFARVRSLRPNAAKMDKVALCKIGHLEEGDPVELGQMMGDLARRHPHLDVFGGCCGSWESHLEEIARNLRAARAPAPA